MTGQTVISVDTKEGVSQAAREQGREWQPEGEPQKVLVQRSCTPSRDANGRNLLFDALDRLATFEALPLKGKYGR
jgi:hypothetical protein